MRHYSMPGKRLVTETRADGRDVSLHRKHTECLTRSTDAGEGTYSPGHVDIPNALLARQTEEQLGSGSNKHLIHSLNRLGRTLLGDSCLARKFDCILILSGCWLDVGACSSSHTSPDGHDLRILLSYITGRPGFVDTPPGIHHQTARSLHTHNHPLTDVADSMTSIHRHSGRKVLRQTATLWPCGSTCMRRVGRDHVCVAFLERRAENVCVCVAFLERRAENVCVRGIP